MAPPKNLSKNAFTVFFSIYLIFFSLVFVTGNANKLREVKAILSEGGHPIEIDSQSLESGLTAPLFLFSTHKTQFFLVPEIQGTTIEVATDKCRRAAELVRQWYLLVQLSLNFTSGRRPLYHRRHCSLLCGSERASRTLHKAFYGSSWP